MMVFVLCYLASWACANQVEAVSSELGNLSNYRRAAAAADVPNGNHGCCDHAIP